MVAVAIEPNAACMSTKWRTFIPTFLLNQKIAVKYLRFPKSQFALVAIYKFV